MRRARSRRSRRCCGTIRRRGRSSSAHVDKRRGARADSCPTRYARVNPVSTMSSTSTTSRPPMSVSRSCRILTRPESGANREIDMKSTVTSTSGTARARSATKISAPFNTADEHDAVGMVAGDLLSEPADMAVDRRLIEENRRRHGSSGFQLPVNRRSIERAPDRLAQERRPEPASEAGELRERLGGARLRFGIALAPIRQQAPVRTGSLRAPRTRGTCGGGGARCRGA